MTHFSSSTEFFTWLSRFINLESGLPPAKSFRLDRTELLAELAGNPERCAPSVHIAGSKGKGSVTGMIASMLEAGGKRAARYMSPHISDFRERVSLGNSFFDEKVYCAAADELRDLVERKLPAAHISLFDPDNEEGEAPTFFELLTLFFFLCARAGGCNAMVVETGMGGRLDCTNIVTPEVSVITLIELEHTAFLGKTIAAVAGEKAGIIKRGRPVILARQPGGALEVFREKAAEQDSPLFYFPEIASIENIKVQRGGTDFSLIFNEKCITHNTLRLSVPIPGEVQAENAGLAVAALKTTFRDISEEAIRLGLERLKIPARFENITAIYGGGGENAGSAADAPPFIIDGAHTPQSASLCADTFCSLYGEGGILLFGCAADKNAAAMAEILLPHFSRIIITTPGTFRISSPEKVFGAFSSAKTIFVKDSGEAIQRTLELSRDTGLPVLCTGSFYLASVVRNTILNGVNHGN